MSNKEKEVLTTEELKTVLEFSQGLYNGINGFGYFNPFNQNDKLLEISGNIAKPTHESLLKALERVPYDYSQLASYSDFMKVWDAIYAKTLRYFSGLLAFDLSFTCKNIKNPSDYKSEDYKKDIKRVYKFLDSFDYKLEFKKY